MVFIQMRIVHESVDWLGYEIETTSRVDGIVDCCGYWLVIGSDDYILCMAKHRHGDITYIRQLQDCDNYW